MEGFSGCHTSGMEQPHHISSPACKVAIIFRVSRQRNKGEYGRKESGAELGLFQVPFRALTSQKEAAGLRVLWTQETSAHSASWFPLLQTHPFLRGL